MNADESGADDDQDAMSSDGSDSSDFAEDEDGEGEFNDIINEPGVLIGEDLLEAEFKAPDPSG